ncbi:MAG: class I SAM-dependent methyltransferase [Bdellovibrionia bacterium]
MNTSLFPSQLDEALERRQPLLESLQNEGTNAYRLFHGVAEGVPGLTIDRYGPLVLAQTFRVPFLPDELAAIENALTEKLPYPFSFAYNNRSKSPSQSFDEWHRPKPEALAEFHCEEFGTKYLIRARHQGIDPWLFLDLRAGRRFLRENVSGLSVLNLFSYTCSIGITAAFGGASKVWNVDFSSSSLEVGRKNAILNNIPDERFLTIEQDCWPVMKQIAGLPVGGRSAKARKYSKFEPHQFDWVILDPPAWAKSPFGAVDVAGDYQSLFKPAVLSARPNGGRIMATNHLPSVDLDDWLNVLKKCAAKAGRPIRSIQVILPENDFPTFDGHHPLKIAVCEV